MAVKFDKVEEGKYTLDVCGFVCPHPQIYCTKSLEKVNEGDIIELTFDNPSSGETIVQMCEAAGHEILEKKSEGGKLIYIIEKG